jgi:G3E family GTPase
MLATQGFQAYLFRTLVQVEYANVIIINKCDTVSQQTVQQLELLLQMLSPSAKVCLCHGHLGNQPWLIAKVDYLTWFPPLASALPRKHSDVASSHPSAALNCGAFRISLITLQEVLGCGILRIPCGHSSAAPSRFQCM